MTLGILGRGAIGDLFARELGRVAAVRTFGRTDATSGLRGVAFLFVAVKSHATVEALAALRGVFDDATVLVSLQNGLDHVTHVDAALGAARPLALAPTSEGATRLRDGSVRRAGVGKTRIGWAAGRAAGSLQPLADLLEAAGLPAEVVAPVEPWVWAKAVANAAINPLTALAGITNGVLLDDGPLAERAAGLAREAAAVAAAEGVKLPFADPFAYVLDVARATASNRSSMLQDFDAGRPTEIDSINGAIVRRGHALGIATPENARVLDEVRARTTA